MKTVLVTGGAGFIGSHLCDKLLSEKYKVICIDNFNDYYDPKIKKKNISHNLKNKNFELYKIDILDFNKLEKVFSKHKIDFIVHLAARAGVRLSITHPEIYEQVNVNGTLNLLEMARKHKVLNFIFSSSSSVYGTNRKVPFSESDRVENQISPYATTKLSAETICKNYYNSYDLNITCFRLFTVYGPRGRPDMAPYKFVDKIFHGKPIEMYGDGSSARDYTYVGDIVEGIFSALNKNFGFEIINLGESRPIKLKEFISVIETVVGKKAKVIQKEMPEGDVPITYANIKKANKLIRYNPKVGINEGMNNFFRWYKK